MVESSDQPQLSEQYVRARMTATRNLKGLLFGGFLAAGIGAEEIARASTGPAADIVHVVAGVLGIFAFIFGVVFFTHFGDAKRALRDLPHYKSDPDAFRKVHRSALEIIWK